MNKSTVLPYKGTSYGSRAVDYIPRTDAAECTLNVGLVKRDHV